MLVRRLRLADLGLAVWVAIVAIATQAAAQERFSGQWDIAGAVVAPWASDPKDASDEADANRLVGQMARIGPGVFRAPRPLGCANPTFVLRNTTADMLFEGSLSADGAGKPTDPIVVARALGITTKTMRGMTANCSEVEFVLVDPNKIMFGLNNRVFTMKRAK